MIIMLMILTLLKPTEYFDVIRNGQPKKFLKKSRM
nr:MAG TPA: hypothetical protein [Caudoviricetes sp.]